MGRVDNIISSMDSFEKEMMLRCWQAAENCADNFNKERSFIYWNDLESVMNELKKGDFISEEHFDYVMQELEQKMYYVRDEKALQQGEKDEGDS